MSGLVSGLPLVLERASMSSLDMTLSGGSGGAGDVLINSPLAGKNETLSSGPPTAAAGSQTRQAGLVPPSEALTW